MSPWGHRMCYCYQWHAGKMSPRCSDWGWLFCWCQLDLGQRGIAGNPCDPAEACSKPGHGTFTLPDDATLAEVSHEVSLHMVVWRSHTEPRWFWRLECNRTICYRQLIGVSQNQGLPYFQCHHWYLRVLGYLVISILQGAITAWRTMERTNSAANYLVVIWDRKGMMPAHHLLPPLRFGLLS